MNFDEVRRAQLAKSTFLTSSLVHLGSVKIYSDAKKSVGCGKQWEATAPIHSLVKLQPWFLNLRWKTCLLQNCCLGSCACSEGPALGQNTLNNNNNNNRSESNISVNNISVNNNSVTYVTAHPPTFPLLHLRHTSFSNPYFASPTSQAFHLGLIHLASRSWHDCTSAWSRNKIITGKMSRVCGTSGDERAC